MDSSFIPLWQQTSRESLFHAIACIRQYLENKIGVQDQYSLDSLTVPENSALGKLERIFNLSPFERDILLLCVGMEIDPNFGELCAKVQGNPQKNYPTLALALSALPNASWSVCSPQNPIQQWQLIEFSAGYTLTQTPIRIDQRIFSYLLGETALDPQLQGLLSPLPNSIAQIPLSPSQEFIVEQCVNQWLEITNEYPILQLCGVDLTAKYRLALEISQQLDFNLAVISAALIPHVPQEIHHLKKRWEREAFLNNSILLLNCDDIAVNSYPQNLNISLFLESVTTPVIISTSERQKTQHRSLINFDVPSLSYNEQIAIWQKHLGAVTNDLNGQITNLTSQFNLTPSVIISACNSLKTHSNQIKIDETDYTTKIEKYLWNFCRTQARPRLEDLAQRIETFASWDDLILPQRQQQTLAEMRASLRQRGKVFEDWGFADKERRGLGISALFSGQSGTGKTMAAGVLANALNLDLYRIDLSSVVSKYIGETEKNLRKIFDAAETGGAILLFDEADALFGKRTEVKDSHDRHANVEVSYLLQRMEAYGGLAILTTNLKESLDSAFMRRIRFVVAFPFPDKAAREEIWRRVFPSQTPTKDLDFQKLARLNIAGGNIRNIALNAAFLAADTDEPIMMKHILQAAESEYLKLEKNLIDTETKGWV
ncbi:AAA ATPase central domain protein [Gloeothece citriformis PCC 7424]|uniref:AAA ATPase central domain protein n=1 Tax=Gloeothece citriformis (strain PCC 7424) TaxID=65393 RepID=B7KK56_GLOC7|nr:ATP-binding protein [Gloeothece citriformis]ACK70941.1 AAA ATPase central domain protein [Gloeothece citriformis PCC 7424]